MSRGQSGFPVGPLREISRVFGIISLQNRRITSLGYNSTVCLGGMERGMCLSTPTSPTYLCSPQVLSMHGPGAEGG